MFGKHPIRQICSFLISLIGVLWGIKNSKVNTFSANREVALPFLCTVVPRNPFVSRFIVFCFSSIHAVLLMRRLSQVANSIIGPITVNMVNFAKWPRSISHSPCNSMRRYNNFIDAYFDVTQTYRSRYCAFLGPSGVIYPCQIPRFRVII